MNKIAKITIVTSSLALYACGQPETGETTDSDQASQVTTSAPTEVAETDAAGDPLVAQGKSLYLRCRSCHTIEQDGAQLVGPNLYGIYNAKAGQREGFKYSDQLLAADITWDDAALDAWIENPREMVPGNKMIFAGLPDKEDRSALIEYLKTASD